MAEYKKIGRAQQADRRRLPGGALSRRHPEGHAGSGRRHRHQRAGQASSALCEGVEPACAIPLEPYLYHDLTPRVLATPRHFAYIKIAEGCDHPCTFCVIPQYRGKFRSRRFESVISEATRLFQQGVREINLIGQDTTCYGEDLGLKDGLAAAARAPGANRDRRTRSGSGFSTPIRTRSRRSCSTPSPSTTPLVKYIDMPLQHASAQRAEAHEARRDRRYFPQAARAHPPHHSGRRHPHQHHRRLSRRDRRRISRSCASSWKPRSSTGSASSPIPTKTPAPAFALDGKVDARTIYNRKRRLMAIQRKIAGARNRGMVGQRSPGAGIRRPSRKPTCFGKRGCRRRRRDRRRHADQRFRRRRAAARRDPPPAHHRSARLRCGRTLLELLAPTSPAEVPRRDPCPDRYLLRGPQRAAAQPVRT